MDVKIDQNEMFIPVAESSDQEALRALRFGTLIVSQQYLDQLRTQWLGFDPQDADSGRILTAEEAYVISDEVELLQRIAKDAAEPITEYRLPIADDMAPGAAVNFLKQAGMRPVDSQGLPYDWHIRSQQL